MIYLFFVSYVELVFCCTFFDLLVPWISTNDVLSAHLWKCVTKARNIPDATTVRLCLAVNGRDRLGLSANYFGVHCPNLVK